MTTVLVSIRPQFAEAIISGRKGFEIRRQFPDLESGTSIYMYASAPCAAIVGGFTLGDILELSPSAMWRNLRCDMGVDHSVFRDYVRGCRVARALEVLRPFRLRRAAPRAEVLALDTGFSFPQNFRYITSPAILRHLEGLSKPPVSLP